MTLGTAVQPYYFGKMFYPGYQLLDSDFKLPGI